MRSVKMISAFPEIIPDLPENGKTAEPLILEKKETICYIFKNRLKEGDADET